MDAPSKLRQPEIKVNCLWYHRWLLAPFSPYKVNSIQPLFLVGVAFRGIATIPQTGSKILSHEPTAASELDSSGRSHKQLQTCLESTANFSVSQIWVPPYLSLANTTKMVDFSSYSILVEALGF